MLGLMGDAPDTVDAGTISTRLETVRATKKLPLLGHHEIPFVLKEHITFLRQALAEHPNGMKLHAFDANGASLRDEITTRAPASAKPSAIARPMPRDEPVTIATLPERSNKFIAFP